MNKLFSSKAHYQTEYHGNLRHDEINLLLELVNEIEVNEVYGANNALIKAQMIKRLEAFEVLEN